MHKRTKATSIPMRVKKAVYERDGGLCIFCNRRGLPEAHVISRAHGGLGIETNIVTACRTCHDRMDNITDRDMYLAVAVDYLKNIYPDWKSEDQVYKR